jgi:hypothetical protein
MEPNGFEIVPYYMETNNRKENQMNNKPENWEVVEVSDNLLNNISSFISYEVRSNRGHTVAKSLTQNDASLVASAPEMLEMLKICAFQLPDETADEVSELIVKAEGR